MQVSPSTVTEVVTVLLERGYIVDMGRAESTGGRPPSLVEVSPALGGVLAADIGGTHMRVAAADLRGRVLTSQMLLTPTRSAALRRNLLAALDAAEQRLAGPARAVCLSIAGIVHPGNGEISLTTNIEGWRDTSSPSWLARSGAALMVENEANMAAFGEHQFGAASGAHIALFLALGAGVGAGLIIDGQVLRGATGAAGEIGLSRTNLQGTHDELEQQVGGPALLASYQRLRRVRLEDPVELFRLAEQGDEAAIAVTDGALDRLAITVANAILVVNPDRIIVGGGLATAGDLLLKPLRDRTESLLMTTAPEFVLSQLGPDAALLGACTFAAQVVVERLVSELGSRSPE